MEKEKIICVFNGKRRVYYVAQKIATEHLDYNLSVVKTEGTPPDGEIIEISSNIKCEKNYLNGKLNGKLEKYNTDTDTLILRENYKNGVLDGKRTKFYQNGKTFITENYKNGLLHGTVTEYRLDGTPKFEDTYAENILTSRKEYQNTSHAKTEEKMQADTPCKQNEKISEGVYHQNEQKENTKPISSELPLIKEDIVRKITNDCRLYYKKDEIVAKEIFNQNGIIIDSIGSIPDGTVREFYPNGQLKLEESYSNGMLNGIRKKYDELGRLWAEETYLNGKLNGIVRVHNYFKDKIFEEEAYFVNNQLNGVRKTYYPNGKVSVEENYKDGKFEGKRLSYYENGKIGTEESYKKGKLDGLRKRFYDNGQLWSEENYKNGQLEGMKKDYYVSNQVRFEEFYKEGKLDGKRKFYFESGRVMYEEIYFQAKLLERNECKNLTTLN